MTYALGPVKPWVASAADTVGSMFKVSTIYGFGYRDGPSDHPLGLALDFMVYGDTAKGQQIADFVQSNAGALSVKYIIWYQRIWSVERSSEGWRAMEDRGSTTANHKDHVHVSFNSSQTGGGNATQTDFHIPIPDIPGVPDPGDLVQGGADAVEGVKKVGEFFAWISDPHNLMRIGLVLAGFGLILLGVIRLGAGDQVKAAANTAGKVIG